MDEYVNEKLSFPPAKIDFRVKLVRADPKCKVLYNDPLKMNSDVFMIPNNFGDVEAAQPPGWNKNLPLYPSQLRSLGWMIRREEGSDLVNVKTKNYIEGKDLEDKV